MIKVCDTVFVFVRLPRMFLSVDCLFEKRIRKLPCISFISHLHIKLRMISRSVPGLAIDSPRDVRGRGLTTCLLYDGPLLALWVFLMINGICCSVQVCYSGDELFIDFLPLFIFHTLPRFSYYLSSQMILFWNSFNTKYFALPHCKDIASTLSDRVI